MPASPRPTSEPVPITGLNSRYDDFNTADISFLRQHVLVFSTNRGSQGRDFDLYTSTLLWQAAEDSAPTEPTRFEATEPTPFAPKLMSDGNERGPLVLDRGDGIVSLVLASDRAGGLGGLDLYAADCGKDFYSHELPCEHATGLHPLTALNSPADDGYLSLSFAEGQRLFASSRAGGAKMDIYAARWASGATIEAPPEAIERVDALSSDADDTAPYVDGNDVVFASGRAGGLGEHDLYCSRFVDGAWTAPVNLGTAINSPRDEYRPIVIRVNQTPFLIFSSTRDGGQGGYDLYIVGYRGCPRSRVPSRRTSCLDTRSRRSASRGRICAVSSTSRRSRATPPALRGWPDPLHP